MPAFLPTRWTLVQRSQGDTPEARTALGELCEAYYRPVESFVRMQVPDPEQARDLTQEFFARLLSGTGFAGAEAGRGRFRSYVLGAVKHFLQAQRTRDRAAKRGSGIQHVPLHGPGETHRESEADTAAEANLPDPRASRADAEFDRRWALAVLDRALGLLEQELADEGRSAWFEVLKPCLLGTGTSIPSRAELATRLGMTETAVKVAIHRLRKRFRDGVRAEIASTLAESGQVEEEMRCLMAALGGAS